PHEHRRSRQSLLRSKDCYVTLSESEESPASTAACDSSLPSVIQNDGARHVFCSMSGANAPWRSSE
ncbi:MAG: hypothetical protein ACERKU_09670, partial [Nitrospirota bacterium]